MPSRVGALPHPSQKDHKKNGGRGSSGGAKPRHQGITMQVSPKIIALNTISDSCVFVRSHSDKSLKSHEAHTESFCFSRSSKYCDLV